MICDFAARVIRYVVFGVRAFGGNECVISSRFSRNICNLELLLFCGQLNHFIPVFISISISDTSLSYGNHALYVCYVEPSMMHKNYTTHIYAS